MTFLVNMMSTLMSLTMSSLTTFPPIVYLIVTYLQPRLEQPCGSIHGLSVDMDLEVLRGYIEEILILVALNILNHKTFGRDRS